MFVLFYKLIFSPSYDVILSYKKPYEDLQFKN